jgi:hypothetical protein
VLHITVTGTGYQNALVIDVFISAVLHCHTALSEIWAVASVTYSVCVCLTVGCDGCPLDVNCLHASNFIYYFYLFLNITMLIDSLP